MNKISKTIRYQRYTKFVLTQLEYLFLISPRPQFVLAVQPPKDLFIPPRLCPTGEVGLFALCGQC